MVKLRFIRTGKRNQPFFRLVATDKRNPPKGGRFLEILGSVNPLTKQKQLKTERIKYWLSVGAQPSDRVHNLLIEEGIVEDSKRPVHNEPKKEEQPKEEEAAEQAKPKTKPEKDTEKEEEKEEPDAKEEQ